ncbi:MAG: hypothetical protein ACRD2N_04040 [Vicinamibacterales bacterium]
MAASSARASTAPAAEPRNLSSSVVFEYTGTGVGRIQGPVSGRIYRFDGPGARVRVDPRDRAGLASLSVIRWVR